MGQEPSTSNEKTTKIQRLQIKLPSKTIVLQNLSKTQTISNLLSLINTNLDQPSPPIVSLTTPNRSECLNYWLSMPERSLLPLTSDTVLIPVFYSKVPEKISMSTFDILQVIGRGSYSLVTQVRKKDTGMIYAMKSIEKQKILKENLKKHILGEKEILSTVKSPFVAKLHWAFQTKNKLHFVMDFYPGGELYFHLKQIRYLTEDQAKFYFCEILLGLHTLHSKEIGYRDLKPENIVIDIDGHIRLTDFGLSRLEFYENSTSFCGSPEYMSPEIILGEGHSKTVDFYCLGALVYEMLTGWPPFYEADTNKMHNRVLNEELSFPEHLTEDCKSILRGLLAKDPIERLGSRGVKEVMKHSWCRSMPWNDFKKKTVKPPFPLDLNKSYFDQKILKSQVPNWFLSDSESTDTDFLEFDFNTERKHDEISKFYFENGSRNRSCSQKQRISLNRRTEVFSGLSTQVSPVFSPNGSLNSSCMNSDPASFVDAVRSTMKKRSLNPLLSLTDRPASKRLNEEVGRGERFGEKLRNSAFNLFNFTK